MTLQPIQMCGPAWLASMLRFRSDESGQDLIEYALLGSLIGLAAVASIRVVANEIKMVFTIIPQRAEQAMFG